MRRYVRARTAVSDSQLFIRAIRILTRAQKLSPRKPQPKLRSQREQGRFRRSPQIIPLPHSKRSERSSAKETIYRLEQRSWSIRLKIFQLEMSIWKWCIRSWKWCSEKSGLQATGGYLFYWKGWSVWRRRFKILKLRRLRFITLQCLSKKSWVL